LKGANVNIEMQRMAMVEISARVDYESRNRIKEERTGIKKNDGLKIYSTCLLPREILISITT
jgi:hypothetical protein